LLGTKNIKMTAYFLQIPLHFTKIYLHIIAFQKNSNKFYFSEKKEYIESSIVTIYHSDRVKEIKAVL